MALQLNKELQNGIVVSYHRVATANYSNGESVVDVRVESWVNEAVRTTEGKLPVLESIFRVELLGEGSLMSQCYEGLKALEDFADATDI